MQKNIKTKSGAGDCLVKTGGRKSYFNIVEIALALAIVGIGIASILALFPIGIRASRNAIGYTSASQVAEEFMSFIKAKSEQSDATYDAVLAEIPEVSVVNDFKAELNQAKFPHEDETSAFLDDLSGGVLAADSEYEPIAKWGNIFRNKHSDRRFVYIVMQRVEDTDAEPDFSAAILMWRAPLDYAGSGGGGVDLTPIDWTPPMSKIMSLNIEISWPLSKVYKDREKRYFYTIIKRP